MPEWLVQLFVDGPIAVKHQIHFQHPKGFNPSPQFYSDVKVFGTSSGLSMSVTAMANVSDLARKAALVFVGEMLNVLATELNEPLRLSLYDARVANRDIYSVKRVLAKEDLLSSFERARWLSHHGETFMRALSWFRKGLVTEDPLDRFLAFWISLEVVVNRYQEVPEGTSPGVKNRLREAFQTLWGAPERWPVIAGESDWIKKNYDLRVQIAHGTTAFEIEHVEDALAKGNKIRTVAHQFLVGWSNLRHQEHALRRLNAN